MSQSQIVVEFSSEEIHYKLTELFETMDELDLFVAYLEENVLSELFERFRFRFLKNDEELARIGNSRSVYETESVVIYSGDIVEEKSSEYLVEYLVSSEELYNILVEISERGIIRDVSIVPPTDADVWINFTINREYTTFTNNDGFPVFFRYIVGGEYPERYGNHHIRDNWYVDISIPLSQSH